MRLRNVDFNFIVAGAFALLAWFSKGKQKFKGES